MNETTTATAENLVEALNAWDATFYAADEDAQYHMSWWDVVIGHPAYDAAATEQLDNDNEVCTVDGRMVLHNGTEWIAVDR